MSNDDHVSVQMSDSCNDCEKFKCRSEGSEGLKCSFVIQMVEMRLSIEGLEKERDFYFGKLRDIEVVIQESADAADPMASKVLEVLYATEVKHSLCFANIFCTEYFVLGETQDFTNNCTFSQIFPF